MPQLNLGCIWTAVGLSACTVYRSIRGERICHWQGAAMILPC